MTPFSGQPCDSGVSFVVAVRTSLDEDFKRVTAPLAKATFRGQATE
jgi:hypothetical protein